MILTIHHATFGQLAFLFLEKARREPCVAKDNCKASQKTGTSQMLHMVFLNSVIDSLTKQQGQKVRMEGKKELMAMQAMNMCKRRHSVTENELWSVVRTSKNTVN